MMWEKTESFYMTKYFSKTTTLLISNGREKIHSGLVDIISQDHWWLENIEVKIYDEDNALLLLRSLTRSFEHLKDVLIYGKEFTTTLNEVQTGDRRGNEPRGMSK